MLKVICNKKRNPSTTYLLFFRYDIILKDKIKAYPEDKRTFNKKLKCWEISSIELFDLIKQHKGSKDIFFDFSKDGKDIFLKSIEKEKLIAIEKEKNLQKENDKQIVAKQLKDYLNNGGYKIIDHEKHLNNGIIPYPHQLIGAKLGTELEKMIIAADMGTGKTLMSILSTEMKEYKKVLVIVPNNLKLNWRNEIKLFTNSKWFILNPEKKSTNIYTVEESKYIIVNYEYFRSSKFNVKEKLYKLGVDPNQIECLICDEVHRLKNQQSNTSKNINKYFKNPKGMLLLSGTIMPNRLEELYVVLKLILPNEIKNKKYFLETYCGKVWNTELGMYEDTEPDLDGLFNKLDGIMYRVKKSDVLKDLPEIVITKIDYEFTPTQRKEYDEIVSIGVNDIDIWDNSEEYGNKLAILTKLRQYTSDVKSGQYLIDLIKELNENNEKVVIFDIYKKNLKRLADEVPNSQYYGGDISLDERQNLVDQFQNTNNKELMNLFITMQSGNTGITLTAASYMFLINQSYVPGENEQTYARINRIGSKNTSQIFILCIDDTIDQDVYNINNEKQTVISKVIDNQDYEDNNKRSVTDELIKRLSKFRKK